MVRCQFCRAAFEPGHPRGRFCKPACRAAAWQQRRARAQVERDAQVAARISALVALLEEALEEAREPLAEEDG